MWLMPELGNALSAFANSKMEKMGCPDHSHYLVCPLPQRDSWGWDKGSAAESNPHEKGSSDRNPISIGLRFRTIQTQTRDTCRHFVQ
jgi:hypothetical protein